MSTTLTLSTRRSKLCYCLTSIFFLPDNIKELESLCSALQPALAVISQSCQSSRSNLNLTNAAVKNMEKFLSLKLSYGSPPRNVLCFSKLPMPGLHSNCCKWAEEGLLCLKPCSPSSLEERHGANTHCGLGPAHSPSAAAPRSPPTTGIHKMLCWANCCSSRARAKARGCKHRAEARGSKLLLEAHTCPPCAGPCTEFLSFLERPLNLCLWKE